MRSGPRKATGRRAGNWYVAAALRRREAAIGAALRAGAAGGAVALALGLAACGDDSEQAATDYEVSAEASFPEPQKLAQTSQLRIEVTNEDDETIPDVGVIVDGFSYELTDPNDPEQPDPAVADPSRPQFVVERSPIEFFAEAAEGEEASLVDREVAVPYGRGTAYAGTYTLGSLAPGKTALFRWDVTAVKAGPYEIAWQITGDTAPGHNIVDEVGEPVSGSFEGKVSDAPVDARVGKDGTTVIREGQGGARRSEDYGGGPGAGGGSDAGGAESGSGGGEAGSGSGGDSDGY